MGRERKRPKGAATFVATFRVGFSPSQRKKAAARFNAGTALYNAALREALDRADRMRSDPRWQKARDLPKDDPARKPLFNEARAAAGFDKGALASLGSRLRVGWLREGAAAQEAQALAERAYGAVAEWVYGPRGRPRFKAMARGVRSMSSKDGNGALRVTATGRHLQWGRGFVAPLAVDPANPVHTHGLAAIDAGRVLAVRIVRRVIKGRDYYDAQLVCDGDPARRYDTRAGVVGLDLGPSTVAVVPDEGAFLETFCDGLHRNDAEVRRLQRKLDRQHRAGSPGLLRCQGPAPHRPLPVGPLRSGPRDRRAAGRGAPPQGRAPQSVARQPHQPDPRAGHHDPRGEAVQGRLAEEVRPLGRLPGAGPVPDTAVPQSRECRRDHGAGQPVRGTPLAEVCVRVGREETAVPAPPRLPMRGA
jgi:hypothetical protein